MKVSILRPFLAFALALWCFPAAGGKGYTEAEALAAWQKLKKQAVTGETFREVCDLAQDVAKDHIGLSYEILADYLPLVRKTGNKQWIHILLMGWARAKASYHFFEEAEGLYRQARQNAPDTSVLFREALVGTVLLYGEWERPDSMRKYTGLGESACIRARDHENLSFIYTFKAMSDMVDTTAMRSYLTKAISLASDLKDKNALFTARYNHANIFLQHNPLKQVQEFEELLELAKDPSLDHYPRKLYERTAFTFRSAAPSVYYQLMQLNLLLMDFENADKFATLFHDAVVRPNPEGGKAAYYYAELSIIKACRKDFEAARILLDKSRRLFRLPEEQIPYVSYFIAAGLLAAHEGDHAKAEHYYKKFVGPHGYSHGLQVLPVELYYAQALIANGKFPEAGKVLSRFDRLAKTRKYSATGYYYYRFLADFYKAKRDFPAYARAIEEFYEVKDSLNNLVRYRAVQEVLARVRIRDKEQQIEKLNDEQQNRERQVRQERALYAVVLTSLLLTIGLLVLYLRNKSLRARHEEALHRSELLRLEKERHLELTERVLEAEEKERRKIADQLHDEVNSMLALASLSVSSALEHGTYSDGRLEKTHGILSSVSATIRDLSHQLNPLTFEKFGFKKALEESVAIINTSGKINLSAVIVGFEGGPDQVSVFLSNVFRIIQELLHNLIRHSGATTASLEVVEHEGLLSVTLEDNGIGISDTDIREGQGIGSIRSRVAYMNGRIEISRRPEGGTMVVIEAYKPGKADEYGK